MRREHGDHWDWITVLLLSATLAYWAVRVIPVLLTN